MGAIGLMRHLRCETRTEHESVEEAFSAPSSLRDLDAYLRLLERFYRVVDPLEREIEASGAFEALSLNAVGRRRREALARDIAHLGGNLASSPPEKNSTHGYAIGALYVLEGSTLGGQIIARSVRQNLGLTTEGVEYFGAHGQETGSRWQEFGQAVNQWGLATGQKEDAIEGARRTFRRFDRSLRQQIL